MQKLLQRLKPGVSKNIHLFSAALLWSVVGTGLMLRGSLWLLAAKTIYLIVPAILLGSLKSLFVLDKTAQKSIERILHLDDGTCLGAVYSVQTWMLVVAMMTVGIFLRHSSIPRSLLGSVYVAIGWALFFSSRHGWRSWRNNFKMVSGK